MLKERVRHYGIIALLSAGVLFGFTHGGLRMAGHPPHHSFGHRPCAHSQVTASPAASGTTTTTTTTTVTTSQH